MNRAPYKVQEVLSIHNQIVKQVFIQRPESASKVLCDTQTYREISHNRNDWSTLEN